MRHVREGKNGLHVGLQQQLPETVVLAAPHHQVMEISVPEPHGPPLPHRGDPSEGMPLLHLLPIAETGELHGNVRHLRVFASFTGIVDGDGKHHNILGDVIQHEFFLPYGVRTGFRSRPAHLYLKKKVMQYKYYKYQY